MNEKKVENSNNAYKQDKLGKIPSWIKIILLKYWVAGATFYFFGMGGYFLWYREGASETSNTIRILAVVGLGYTLFKEYIEKNIIRFMRTSADDTYRYNLINQKGILSFILHLFYCYFLTLMMASVAINFFKFTNVWGTGSAGYEPFSVGLIFLLLDIICIAIKDLIIYIVKNIQYKRAVARQNAIMAEDDVPLYGADLENNNESNLDNFTNEDKDE